MTGYQALTCVVCAHGQQFGRKAMTFRHRLRAAIGKSAPGGHVHRRRYFALNVG